MCPPLPAIRPVAPTLVRVLLLAGIAVQAGPARAALVAAEGFVYPTGSVVPVTGTPGLSGGSGWTSAWGNNYGVDMVTVAGLVYLNSSGFYTTDEVRLGTTAADVLPLA
jgi:hypothetical protein